MRSRKCVDARQSAFGVPSSARRLRSLVLICLLSPACTSDRTWLFGGMPRLDGGSESTVELRDASERPDATTETVTTDDHEVSHASSTLTADRDAGSSPTSTEGPVSDAMTTAAPQDSISDTMSVLESSSNTDPTSDAANPDAGSSSSEAPGLTDLADFERVECTVVADVVLSKEVPAVGVLTFDTDLANAERAVVQFGEQGVYTFEAPSDWQAVGHETMLLGTPFRTEVSYRVLVFRGAQVCVGEAGTYATGAALAGTPAGATLSRGPSAAAAWDGFFLAPIGHYANIIDGRGRVVWSLRFPVALTRVVMSWDGEWLLARDLGPFDAGSGGAIYRVKLDGTLLEKLTLPGGTHHDVTVTPDGITYPAKATAGACDSLYTARIDGSDARHLVDLAVVFDRFGNGQGGGGFERCHVNFVRYYHSTRMYSVSDREKDAIAFISTSGELVGSLGSAPITPTPHHVLAEGADASVTSPWRVQHGHDLYAPNKLVLWSNGVFQGGVSRVLHYTITGETAVLDWQYTGTGSSPTLSDAQRLPNGNFLATNSRTATVHELDASHSLIRAFSNMSRGYTSYRTTLYGAPTGR